jgi:transketolase
LTDIFTALYFHILNNRPDEPNWPDRDRLILSCGHTTPVRYATMAHAGYFPLEELKTLRHFGSRLQGHPERLYLPGLENTSGPLGCGLSQASGMAYAARLDKKLFRIYLIMSDGEQQEGNTWEGAMFAGAYKLANLTAFIDYNNIQIDGQVDKIMPLEPFKEKYESFGWHVIEINGHDFEEIISASEQARAVTNKPTLIMAHTVPGKGVPEIEGDYRWHGVPPGNGPDDVIPKDQQVRHFLEVLRENRGKIESEH